MITSTSEFRINFLPRFFLPLLNRALRSISSFLAKGHFYSSFKPYPNILTGRIAEFFQTETFGICRISKWFFNDNCFLIFLSAKIIILFYVTNFWILVVLVLLLLIEHATSEVVIIYFSPFPFFLLIKSCKF